MWHENRVGRDRVKPKP